jgi:dephospho-CoA kinase
MDGVKILAMVGMSGSGKSAVVGYLTEKGIPKVESAVMDGAVDEIRNLIDAGQRRIVLDGPHSWVEYKTMKKEFPTEMRVVATISPKRLRHERVAKRSERPLEAREIRELDWGEIEDAGRGGPIANADYYIDTSGGIGELHENVKKLLREIEFLKV